MMKKYTKSDDPLRTVALPTKPMSRDQIQRRIDEANGEDERLRLGERSMNTSRDAVYEFKFRESDFKRARDIKIDLLIERNYTPPPETKMLVTTTDAKEFRKRLFAEGIVFEESKL